MMATNQRTGVLRGPGRRFGGQVTGHGGQVGTGLGGQGLASPFLQLVQGQPAFGGLMAQRLQGGVPFRVRDAQLPFRHRLLRSRRLRTSAARRRPAVRAPTAVLN